MAVTDYQSLYAAVNKVALEGISSVQSIGGYDTFIELYTQNDIDDNYTDIIEGNYDSNNNLITKCTFGSNTDESRLILISGDKVEIPENYTLTPICPRKSLVILCDKFINNGTLSMQGKGPNILPHEFYIMGQTDGYDEDIIIPAYANNQTATTSGGGNATGRKGNNGVNRQCGAGGIGGSSSRYGGTAYFCRNGSGTAFAGGAGSGGSKYSGWSGGWDKIGEREVNTTYPMRGAKGQLFEAYYHWEGQGGVGNPRGISTYCSGGGGSWTNYDQNSGVGGRIVIFCSKFINNGTIKTNGTDGRTSTFRGASYGGASGGGAIDIFYNNLIEQGTITSTGGFIGSFQSGGNGAITLTKYNAAAFVLPGYANKETITKFVELVKAGLATKTGIDDTQQRANMTYSSKKIESMIPTSISDLTNDAGFLNRHITAKEVRTIWDDTEV